MLSLANQLYSFFVALGVLTLPVVLLCILLGLTVKRLSNSSGHIVIVGSYIWAVGFWLGCAINVYGAWGSVGLVSGMIMCGVGVIPLSMVAKVVKGFPSGALQDLVMLAVIIGTRIVGARLTARNQTLATAQGAS